jgi:hypothetical protein
LDDKLISTKIRWYGHVIRMSERRILNKVLNMKLKRKYPSQKTEIKMERTGKMFHRSMEEYVRELKTGSPGKTKTDAEASL